MNECDDDTHDCHQDGYCNNTVGLYNCTCHDGYSGDGVDCTGEMLHI